jgi:transposase-like protein
VYLDIRIGRPRRRDEPKRAVEGEPGSSCSAPITRVVSEKRDLAATRRFATRALKHGLAPTERLPTPRVLDELLPAVCHTTEQYANNRSKPITAG